MPFFTLARYRFYPSSYITNMKAEVNSLQNLTNPAHNQKGKNPSNISSTNVTTLWPSSLDSTTNYLDQRSSIPVLFYGQFHTCLKLPLRLCSQSIMSWKMGIITFLRSGWGIKVTSRKGPINAGIKWSLCSPKMKVNMNLNHVNYELANNANII